MSGPVRVMARPHNLRIAPGGEGAWRGAVAFHRVVGPLVEYHVEVADGGALRVVAMRQERARPLEEGAPVSVSVLDPALCAVYPA